MNKTRQIVNRFVKKLPGDANAGREAEAFVFVVICRGVGDAVLPFQLVAVEKGVESQVELVN